MQHFQKTTSPITRTFFSWKPIIHSLNLCSHKINCSCRKLTKYVCLKILTQEMQKYPPFLSNYKGEAQWIFLTQRQTDKTLKQRIIPLHERNTGAAGSRGSPCLFNHWSLIQTPSPEQILCMHDGESGSWFTRSL